MTLLEAARALLAAQLEPGRGGPGSSEYDDLRAAVEAETEWNTSMFGAAKAVLASAANRGRHADSWLVSEGSLDAMRKAVALQEHGQPPEPRPSPVAEVGEVTGIPRDLRPSWPVSDVLQRLADAAEHLLRDHDCDAHGHEGVRVAVSAALQHLPDVRSREAAVGRLVHEAEQALSYFERVGLKDTAKHMRAALEEVRRG